ncbi:NAD(P)-binding protein [Xylariaceae sp. FL0662B]|nr:NAD(P)-binding protein [Xylariaceae sp. FL0662B]
MSIDINTNRNRPPGIIYHTGDISSLVEVEALFAKAKPKTIFHVACPDSTAQQPAVFQRVNVVGARNLLASARNVKTVQAFVNVFTSSVIHDNLTDLIDADEYLPVLQYPAQKRVYTLTKAEAEAEILAANRENGDSSMLTVSLRPAAAFGERDTICMGKIVANARAGKAKFQMGPGNNLNDFVYISNLVDAHILAADALARAYRKLSSPLNMRVDSQSFNVTNDERVEFCEFSRAIAASVGIPINKEEIKVIPVWLALTMAAISKGQPIVTREAIHLTTITRTLSCEKAKRVLAYKPKVSVDEGLAIAGKWFREESKRAEDAKKAA